MTEGGTTPMHFAYGFTRFWYFRGLLDSA